MNDDYALMALPSTPFANYQRDTSVLNESVMKYELNIYIQPISILISESLTIKARHSFGDAEFGQRLHTILPFLIVVANYNCRCHM